MLTNRPKLTKTINAKARHDANYEIEGEPGEVNVCVRDEICECLVHVRLFEGWFGDHAVHHAGDNVEDRGKHVQIEARGLNHEPNCSVSSQRIKGAIFTARWAVDKGVTKNELSVEDCALVPKN